MSASKLTGFLIFASLLALLNVRGQAAPFATFDCREITGRDWARMLVTYPVAFSTGQVKPGKVRLVDATGTELPYQFSHLVKHGDGSIKSGRISFYTELAKGGSYHFELQPGQPAKTTIPPAVTVQGRYLTLDNGITALRLPAGARKFATPLQLVARHDQVAKDCEDLEQRGLAFGPIAGIKLADGRWVGGIRAA
ncbi:MAG: hypothetical protein BWY76_01178 [bacterium ADurb.Bin429]|nr:MAG: hypothetical protein BWY76_01178 [bacterium ADurb.Bin429]